MTVPPHELRARLLTATERSLAASSDFDLNPVSKEKRTASLRDAAVLIGVYSSVDGPCVLLTRRAAHLKHHPNQVAFPGGKVEAKDAHIHAAALREAQEEVGLNPQNIEVLGSLAPHETVTGFSVTPVIGLISSPFNAGGKLFDPSAALAIANAKILCYSVRSVLYMGCNGAYSSGVGRPVGMNIIQADWLKKPGVEKITRLLSDAGFEIYFVGGCVRNSLLNRPVDDIDLASNARPDQIQNLARAAKLKTIPTGIEHGTITVISEGTPYEITTFRQDIETDGRRATIQYADSLKSDATRRDFTMNALYADASGKIYDPLNGLARMPSGGLPKITCVFYGSLGSRPGMPIQIWASILMLWPRLQPRAMAYWGFLKNA